MFSASVRGVFFCVITKNGSDFLRVVILASYTDQARFFLHGMFWVCGGGVFSASMRGVGFFRNAKNYTPGVVFSG